MKRLNILGGLHRYRLDRHISSLLMAIAIGILSGYGAVLFRFAIQGAQYAFYQNTADILTFVSTVPVYCLIGMPALGGLVVGLLVRFGAREAIFIHCVCKVASASNMLFYNGLGYG